MYLGSECFLVEDIRSLLKSYPHLSVSSLERKTVWLMLWQSLLSFDSIAMWFYKGPRWLMSLVLNDVTYCLILELISFQKKKKKKHSFISSVPRKRVQNDNKNMQRKKREKRS